MGTQHSRAFQISGVLILAATLAACTSNSGATTPTSGSNGTGERIAFSSTALSDPYTVTLSELIQADAKAGGFDINPTVDSKNDSAQQITDFTTLLGSGVQGILAVAVDGKAIKTALDEAAKKGVPVVAVDTGPSEGGGDVAITVTTSSVTLGEQACQAIGDALGGTGKVLELQGRLNSQVGLDRSTGFQDCMKKSFPDIAIVSKPANFVQEDATTAAQTVLSTDSDVDAIFLASDSAYLPGVLTVLDRLGRLKPVGDAGHVAVVGIDGSPFALEQVREGFVDASVSQPMTGYAQYGLEYLRAAINGETFTPGPTDHDSEIVEVSGGGLADILKPTIVTKDNADDSALWGNFGDGQ